jgi:heat-inducible transcriptional repressor
MADLEEMGLIHSPHTSAGRVPTASGYRLFVDSLLTVKPLLGSELDQLQTSFNAKADQVTDVVGKASKLLSEVTQMAGVVTLPRRDSVSLRHIEFLPMSSTRVLVIFVTDTEEVHNKIIHTQRLFSPAELQQAANYLNAVYAGRNLSTIREHVLKDLEQDRHVVNQAMLDAVSMAQLTFNHQPKDDYVLSGETNLMGFSELSDVDRLKQLFDAFSQKHSMIHLLDQCLAADGVLPVSLDALINVIDIANFSGYEVSIICDWLAFLYSICVHVCARNAPGALYVACVVQASVMVS